MISDGKRNAGGFDAHQGSDAGVSQCADDLGDEVDQIGQNTFGHGLTSI